MMTENLANDNPLILAIDTSQPTLCLALLSGAELLASVVDTSGAPHSQRLFPLLLDLLDTQSLSPASLDLLAVNTGPGSFTGLRVGLAAAQGLAATLRKPALGVNALDALAVAAGVVERRVVTLVNASRAEMFCGMRIVQSDLTVRMIGADHVASFEKLLPELQTGLAKEAVIFTGNGAGEQWATLQSLSPFWRLVDAPTSLAPTIARLARQRWQKGESSPLSAYYIRPSEAEIKLGK